MRCVECHSETDVSPCHSCGKDPRVGGRYAIVERVGGGATGVVFRGTDVTTGDAVAIKEVMLGGLADGKSRELALREARVLRQLHHAAIPAWRDEVTLGVGRSAALYLVQDFEDGVDLQEGLVAHRWSEREVLEVMHEVLGALEYLHGLHPPVIHRDIKPANLIRRTDGSLALVDFGAVRDALRSSQGGGQTVAGTFGFMAPEQFAGQAEPRSDLYALGMTAVALLSRKAPALLHDRAGQLAWEPVVSVSSRTTVLLRSLLQPDPALRPVSAAVVRQTIEQILASGEAVSPGRSNHSTSESVSAQGRPTRLPVAEAERRAEPVHQPELEDHALIRGQDAPGAGLAAREGASVAQRRTDSTTWGVAMALAFLVCVSIGIALKFAPTNSPPATTPAPPPVSAPATVDPVPAGRTGTVTPVGVPGFTTCSYKGEAGEALLSHPELVEREFEPEDFLARGTPRYPTGAVVEGDVKCSARLFFDADGQIGVVQVSHTDCPEEFRQSLCSAGSQFQRIPDPTGRPVEVPLPIRYKAEKRRYETKYEIKN